MVIVFVFLGVLTLGCEDSSPTGSSTEEKKSTEPKEMPLTTEERCAVNMGKLAILVQEGSRYNVNISVDDDVSCPTQKQLQEVRETIDDQIKKIADADADAERIRVEEEEAERQRRAAKIHAEAAKDPLNRQTIPRNQLERCSRKVGANC